MKTAYIITDNPAERDILILYTSLFEASKSINVIRRTYNIKRKLFEVQVPDELYKSGLIIRSSDIISMKII